MSGRARLVPRILVFPGIRTSKRDMRFIKVLPEGLIDRIAAGEVIENPASVVKELVENSIDASAENIEISIIGGGKEEILIVDDGEGIPKDQVEVAFMRHATSKIHSWDDLLRTGTMGFRGEALPSISSVSIMELVTGCKDETMGSRIKFEGGKQVHFGPAPPRKGCSISVRNLFYNVPARRKFLKSESAEKRRVAETIRRYIIARPETGFKLAYDGKSKSSFPATDDPLRRLEAVWGSKVAGDLISIEGERISPVRVYGCISAPTTVRGNRSEMYFFVNKRPVLERALFGAVAAAYEGSIPKGQYPYVAIFLEIDPGFVDINVHPAKIEVRFADEGFIFSILKNAMRKALQLPAGILLKTPPPATDTIPFEQVKRELFGNGQKKSGPATPIIEKPSGRQPGEASEPVSQEAEIASAFQIFDTYIIARRGTELVILDQHTAHERILFERTLDSFSRQPIPSQKLLFETRVKLTPGEAALIDELLDLLEKAGFEIRPFGDDEVILSGLPQDLSNISPEIALKDLLADFSANRKAGEETKKALAAGVACRAAIKAGYRLSETQMKGLYADLLECREPYRCPHGRPTMAALKRDDLERIFQRR